MRRKEAIRRTLIVLAAIAVLTVTGIRNSPEYVHNPDNQPFRLEVAFNLGIDELEVNQLQFKERYLK